MASTSASTSSPSTSTSAFLTDDTFMGFRSEVDLSFKNIFEVQDQLCRLLEVKQEEDMQQWMEMQWEEQMLERDAVVSVVDSQLAKLAGEKAAGEIWKKWYVVSVSFFLILTFQN